MPWLNLLLAPCLAASPAGTAASTAAASALYFDGKIHESAAAYTRVLKAEPKNLEAWLSGAIAFSELAENQRSEQWLREALEISPDDAEVRLALGETEFRLRRYEAARREAQAVLASRPKDPYAQILLGRVELALNRPKAAVEPLAAAAKLDEQLTLAHYWLGKAREALRDNPGAIEAYKRAVQGDSYFSQARYELSRICVRSSRFYEAWKQASRLIDIDPRNARFRKLLSGVSRSAIASTRPAHEDRPPSIPASPKREALEPPAPQRGRIPTLRVGLGASPMGKPLPRREFSFHCTADFDVLDAKSGRALACGSRGEQWKVRVPASKSFRVEVLDENGRRRVRSALAILIRPQADSGGTVVLKDIPADYASVARGGGERPLRGAVEASPFPGRRALALVNVVDLESYTHGVLASEMPIVSPVEALKAQAVVARTHALFIKTVTLRHKKDGFDICDGQHCQVYWGVRNESAKSRAIVEATRGRVVAYEGRIAHVLYASNCGGHTQSGKDLRGWGNVPYWKGVTDADPRVRPPASPWELRLWLRTRPAAFCRASSFVHPSHFRWTRVIPAADLEDRINRSLKIGRLLGIRTLQRSPSGHLNSVAVVGSRQSPVVSKEISIRGLLGDGSQRSALFMVETESDEKGRPLRFTFYGGGWGHGVGMCQSGAIGRAGEGRSYADILASYYAGTQLGNLRY